TVYSPSLLNVTPYCWLALRLDHEAPPLSEYCTDWRAPLSCGWTEKRTGTLYTPPTPVGVSGARVCATVGGWTSATPSPTKVRLSTASSSAEVTNSCPVPCGAPARSTSTSCHPLPPGIWATAKGSASAASQRSW